MNCTGFITEIDEYAFSKSLKEYYPVETTISPGRELVIAHLKAGVLCVALIGIAEDEDEARMGTTSVYTDGEWFWPAYYASFLEKYPAFKIDPVFERHVMESQGKSISPDDPALAALEKEFLLKSGFKEE